MYDVHKTQPIDVSCPDGYLAIKAFRNKNLESNTPVWGCCLFLGGSSVTLTEHLYYNYGHETDCLHIKPVGFDTDNATRVDHIPSGYKLLFNGGYEEVLSNIPGHSEKRTTTWYSGNSCRQMNIMTIHESRRGYEPYDDTYVHEDYYWEVINLTPTTVTVKTTLTKCISSKYPECTHTYQTTTSVSYYSRTDKGRAYGTFQFNAPEDSEIPLSVLSTGIRSSIVSDDRVDADDFRLNQAIQSAYYDALKEAVSKFNDNSFQNAKEFIAGLGKCVNALLTGHLDIDLADSWQSWWLQYRYAFCTTKMDAEEGYRFLRKQMRLANGQLSPDNRYYGFSAFDDEHGNSHKIRCRVQATEKNQLSGWDELKFALWQWGFSPNFYVVWDALPFSFMVDWALPMGNVFGILADAEYLNEQYIEFKDICLSDSYSTTDITTGIQYDIYMRWHTEPFEIDEMYWFDNSASTKSKIKRGVDTVALVTTIVPH